MVGLNCLFLTVPLTTQFHTKKSCLYTTYLLNIMVATTQTLSQIKSQDIIGHIKQHFITSPHIYHQWHSISCKMLYQKFGAPQPSTWQHAIWWTTHKWIHSDFVVGGLGVRGVLLLGAIIIIIIIIIISSSSSSSSSSFGLGMSTNVNKCQRLSAYDQRTLRMATVIIRKLYVKYVTQSSGIRQDVIYVADTPDIL